jgi:hypothetical protein
MDIQQWQSMLERRGYRVKVWQDGAHIKYVIPGVSQVTRPVNQFSRMSYKEARKQIDQYLGHGMRHALHTCGFPLLYALSGYTCDDPFYRVEESFRKTQYYAVPLLVNSQPLTVCPQCGSTLDAKTVHRVKDPEAIQ